MRIRHSSRNTVVVETEPGEALYYPPRFLRTRGFTLKSKPAFWNQCLIGRLWHDCYWLQHSAGGPQPASTTLTGLTPTGSFEKLALAAGERAFVSLDHLAGFVVPDSRRAAGARPVLQPVLRGLVRPTFWLMGHPVPCVFEGPVTVLLQGAALRWDDDPHRKEYQPRQVVAFDAGRPFGVLAMQPGANPLSLVYNALTFESRFVAEGYPVLVEDYVAPPRVNLRFLQHFIAHAVFALLLLLLLWLNR